jgi:ATP adenylyltransferase
VNDRDGLQPAERLWTPWRMSYVGGGSTDPGCVFCRVQETVDDIASLVVHRGERAFVIMNLYPYNTGHLMVVPNDHQSDLARLSPETRAEMAELTASFTTGLRRALRCEGFNTGMNLGDVAGAGIADHLHQHIVPRWRGDANFMPIVGSTKVLPELIPATYAKIRADVARQKSGLHEVVLVATDASREHVLLDGGRLPRIPVQPDESSWPAALAWLRPRVATADLIGWAGPTSTTADVDTPPALALEVTPVDTAMTPVADAMHTIPPGDRDTVQATIDRSS